jgi:hypothetical protein
MTKPTCLGTRVVAFKFEAGGNPNKEGLLIVSSDEKDPNTLQVSICNGRTTFTGEVVMDQVKLSPEDRQQLATYLLQDNSKHATIEITFLYCQDGGLELNIKQCLASGLKKFAYSTVLFETEKASVLQFLHTLGDSLNTSIDKNDQHQEEMRNVQQRLDDWKDTALKLDKDVWQHEKDQLLQNFLTLFNDAQTKAKEQLKELQEELDLFKRTSQHRGGTRALAPLFDAPDDLDEPGKEPIPLDEVAALAQGKQTITTRKSILDPSEILSSSHLKQTSQQYKEQQQADKKSKTNKAAPSKKPAALAPAVKKEKKARPKSKIPVPSFGGSLEDDNGDSGGDMPPALKKVKQENKEDSEEEAMRQAIRENVRKDKATVSKGKADYSSKTKGKLQDDQPTKLEEDEAMQRREELWKKVGAMDDDDSSTDGDF